MLWFGAPATATQVWPLVQHTFWLGPLTGLREQTWPVQQTGLPVVASVMQVPVVQQMEVLLTLLVHTRLVWQQAPPTQVPFVNWLVEQGLPFWLVSGEQVPALHVSHEGQLATQVLVDVSQQPLVHAVPVAQQLWPVPPHVATHCPLVQVWLLVHAIPQTPQLLVSVEVLTQVPLQQLPVAPDGKVQVFPFLVLSAVQVLLALQLWQAEQVLVQAIVPPQPSGADPHGCVAGQVVAGVQQVLLVVQT